MSKVTNDHLRKSIETVIAGSEEKKRDFVETIELQIGLKNYDPQKDKRFAGTIKLPHFSALVPHPCAAGVPVDRRTPAVPDLGLNATLRWQRPRRILLEEAWCCST